MSTWSAVSVPTPRMVDSPLGDLVDRVASRYFRQTNGIHQGNALAPAPAILAQSVRSRWDDFDATTSTTVTDARVIGDLQHLYVLRGAVAVTGILREQPDIAALLLEAAGWIAASFGRNTNVALEIVTDPGDDGDTGSLHASIRTNLEPEQARPLMKQFQDSWWTSASIRARDELNFGLEYH